MGANVDQSYLWDRQVWLADLDLNRLTPTQRDHMLDVLRYPTWCPDAEARIANSPPGNTGSAPSPFAWPAACRGPAQTRL